MIKIKFMINTYTIKIKMNFATFVSVKALVQRQL